MKKITILFLFINIISCSFDDVRYDYPQDPDHVRKSRSGKYFGNDLTVYRYKDRPRAKSTPPKIYNNNELWVASLEVIGGILPIIGADESSGMILTDWHQDKSREDQRMKINFLVRGKQISQNNLVVSIFRQRRDVNQNWIDVYKKSEDVLVDKIKEKIINRAIQLSKETN